MTERICRSPLAEKDVADLAEFYRTEAGLAVALRFVVHAEAATQAIAAYPKIGAALGLTSDPDLDIRRWHIERFPRLMVLYRQTGSGIHIIRVIDAARDLESIFQDERS
jgi:plasmid stabilization system protein ParE